jgi:hypothetical protein
MTQQNGQMTKRWPAFRRARSAGSAATQQRRRGGPRLTLNKTAEKSVRSFDAVSAFLYLDSPE